MKKFLSFILTLSMVLGMSFTTFAATDVNTSGTAESKVVKTVDSEFSVLIPKKIELTSEKADFTVQAEGNIAAIETLEVTVDETVDMKRAGDDTYDDMDASVSLEGCTWNDTTLTSEYTSHEGSVSFGETKAGEYSGTGTFYINLKSTKIQVTSIDAAGNNLNASAYQIVGEEEKILINGLVDSNLISSVEDVDALIEVESDDFEGMADTTFDVSNIAKEGDTVVILHYDEESETWEHISTETVDENLEVNADFSSYSPVAFVVISESGSGSGELDLSTVNTDLATNTWEDVQKVVKAGKVAEAGWKVGDTKTLTINGQEKEATIIGINHDSENTATFMVMSNIGSHAMNSNLSNYGGWRQSEMRSWLNGDIYNSMTDVKDYIKEVTKMTNNVGYQGAEATGTQDKVFLLSVTEVGLSSDYDVDGEGTTYDWFKNNNLNASTALRSSNSYDSDFFLMYYSSWEINIEDHGATDECPVRAAFVIG